MARSRGEASGCWMRIQRAIEVPCYLMYVSIALTYSELCRMSVDPVTWRTTRDICQGLRLATPLTAPISPSPSHITSVDIL
jgi:hypothetical protein